MGLIHLLKFVNSTHPGGKFIVPQRTGEGFKQTFTLTHGDECMVEYVAEGSFQEGEYEYIIKVPTKVDSPCTPAFQSQNVSHASIIESFYDDHVNAIDQESLNIIQARLVGHCELLNLFQKGRAASTMKIYGLHS